MKILVVEDEPKTASYLRNGLMENGFVADVARRGDDGLHAANTGEYDLIILDVMLPERDGWSVLSAMRAGGRSTPVLFLTARDAVQDRVKGLELGADDYLVKPFAFSELLARVRSVLRRGPARHADVVRIADLDPLLLSEHVGDRETAALLRRMGVDHAQGFHLGEPAPLGDWLPDSAAVALT